LLSLNLRLNSLGDVGGRLLLEGVMRNPQMTQLTLSANSLRSEAAATIACILEDPNARLQVLDVSCNEFEEIEFLRLRQALEANCVRRMIILSTWSKVKSFIGIDQL